MTTDNSKQIIGMRIRLFAATVAILTYMVLTYIAGIIRYPLLGLSDTVWTIIAVAVYFAYAFMPMYLNYQYVYFSDEGEKIIFRYFTTGIVSGRKNSIEIDKQTFAGYKKNSRLFGLVRSLILYQNYREGVAKYPEIHTSALSREDEEKIIRTLNRYVPRV
jgi:hypothetical protein